MNTYMRFHDLTSPCHPPAVVSPTIILIMGKLYAQRMIEQKVENEINAAKRMAMLIEERPWEKKVQ